MFHKSAFDFARDFSFDTPYYVVVTDMPETSIGISQEPAHRRFGHPSDESFKHLPDAANGIVTQDRERQFCERCAVGKTRQQPFSKQRQ